MRRDEARQVLALLAVQAGGRLIEQYYRRLERERACKPDKLLQAEGQAVDCRVPVALEFDDIDDALDRCAVRNLGASHARQEQHLGNRVGADARVPPGQEVVEHAHLRKQLPVLERAGNPEARDVMGGTAADIDAIYADGAAAAIDAADAVEHAGLAGSVRTNEREQLAVPDRKRDVVEHDEAAEPQAKMLHRELSHTTSATGDIA